MFDDDLPRPKKKFELGQPLDDYSVSELEEIIEELQSEITRLQGDIEKKKASAAAADSVFK